MVEKSLLKSAFLALQDIALLINFLSTRIVKEAFKSSASYHDRLCSHKRPKACSVRKPFLANGHLSCVRLCLVRECLSESVLQKHYLENNFGTSK